ncbi:hypothetical protein PENTCL1PPCAC_19121, partial [Pristionchus entomophagus]
SVKILLDLSSHVRSLHIHQQYINFFFGAHDVEWASIIIEMFSKKLDKLYLQTHTPNCLSDRICI